MTELKVKIEKGVLKRIAAVALAVCLGAGMLPVSAYAESGIGQAAEVESIIISPSTLELTEIGQTGVLTAEITYKSTTPEDPSAKDPSAKDPSAEDPSAKDPSAKDPSAKDPSAKDPSAEDPSAKDPSAKDPSAKDPDVENTDVGAEISWTSDDTDVVAVSGNGTTATVTAKKEGSATITVEFGGVTATAVVTVKVGNDDDGSDADDNDNDISDIAVETIALDKNELKFDVIGAYQVLSANVNPADATDRTVTWSSDNEKVATVVDGKVTSVGNGTATITAKAGDKTATAAVTVSQKTEKVSITINGQTVKGTLKARVKKTYTLKAIVTPDNADAKNAAVTWSTSNKKVATVSAAGKVKIIKAGTVTITAKTADGNTAKVKFKASKNAVKVTKLVISGTKTMKAKKSQTLNLAVAPATADNQKVTWKSSNTKIATVSAKGKVKAKKKGTVTITATAKDGSGKKATFKIKVK